MRRLSSTVSAGEHVADLRHVADAALDELVGAAPGDVVATEHARDPARIGTSPNIALSKRRLAGAVRPDDADDLALVRRSRSQPWRMSTPGR